MSEQEQKLIREQVALFRYGLIGDLVHRDPNAPGLYEMLRKKAEQTYTIPGSHHDHVAAETIRDWLKAYRKGGFEALVPKPRCDLGTARVLSQDIIDLLVSIKCTRPRPFSA
jgi:putative transposase